MCWWAVVAWRVGVVVVVAGFVRGAVVSLFFFLSLFLVFGGGGEREGRQ